MSKKKLILILILIGFNLASVSAQESCPKYKRSMYKHWVDTDKDCQDARVEVLIEESLVPVTFKGSRNCAVLKGKWDDPYSGKVFTEPLDLDIDHLVPLKETHVSGGWKWSAQKKKEYANAMKDKSHLIAVKKGLNRQKGRKDPALWLPPNKSYLVEYAQAWVKVKLDWGLTIDQAEANKLIEILGPDVELPAIQAECREVRAVPKTVKKSLFTCGSKRYCKHMKSCAEARFYLTECGLGRLDRDKDGIPCEKLCR